MINLTLKSNIFSPKFYPYLYDNHRFMILMGSAGSGKSVFGYQKIIVRCLQEKDIRCVISRRYGSTIRNSVFNATVDILKKWKILKYVHINYSDYRITFPNGSQIIFLGLDDEEKLLSLATISIFMVDESTEVPENILSQINLRLRGGTNQQIIFAFNPISINNPMYEYWTNPPIDAVLIHSTYKDNPWLSEDYVNQLEELRIRNPQKAKIFCDGEFGQDPDGLVIKNWIVEDFDIADLINRKLEHRSGIDFGFVDPSTICDTLYDRANNTIYVFNEFYKTGCQLNDIALALGLMNIKCDIFCDSAEPRSIDFLKRKGFKAKPCIKGPNSVYARITFLQNMRIVVHPRCKHMIADLSNFSYEKDRQTGKYKEDSYTHEWSHLIDALGYAYSDIYTKSKLRTIDKSLLGL